MINIKELSKAFYEFGIKLGENHIIDVFGYLDQHQTGQIQIDDFLNFLKSPMSEERQNLVRRLFRKLDQETGSFLKIDTLGDVYRTSDHPLVRNGTESERKLKKELVQSFSDYLQMVVKWNEKRVLKIGK